MSEEPSVEPGSPDGVGGLEPIVLAMVVCDGLYIDSSTGKKSLMGMFSVINGVQFPATVPQMVLYVAMTNGHGKTPFTLRLIDANEERAALFEGAGIFDFVDPRMVLEFATAIGNIVFPEPGDYRFQMYAFGTLLLERRVLVRDVNQPEEPL